ncbi:hypothetical protein CEXT_665301 [Caerostris extrusa]|uniref:Uncharacterized protein n=1 Tax=Caerostris extrusa TaxID=172846 RepID=A0AAV4UJW7_CAEEX|nr:hypothetical protein CEXT_665301 [Caerostris extrusa]
MGAIVFLETTFIRLSIPRRFLKLLLKLKSCHRKCSRNLLPEIVFFQVASHILFGMPHINGVRYAVHLEILLPNLFIYDPWCNFTPDEI